MDLKQYYKIDLAIITEADLTSTLNFHRPDNITDEMMTSALVCASVRVDALGGGQILENFSKLQPITQSKVKLAACFLAQFYLSGGYNWLAGSTSVSAGQISISQSIPQEPDTMLPHIYSLLQITDENLFKPTISVRRDFSDDRYEESFFDYTPFTPMLWSDALKTFLKPGNLISQDHSVTITLLASPIGEPIVDLKVSVLDVNKYFGDNQTVVIGDKNTITAIGIKDNNHFYTPTQIYNELLKKSSVDALNKKANQDFSDCDLKNLISPSHNNGLVIDPNSQKLYVSKIPSEGGDYEPDGKTIVKNFDATITSVALRGSNSAFVEADEIIKIKNAYVDKNALNEVISSDDKNALVEGADKKLYVKQGGGGTYNADEKTVHLDKATNTFSTIGIEFDPSATQKAVFDKYMVKQALSRITVNQQNIDKINKQLDADELNIKKNTESIRQVVNIVNNKCVQKDKLNDIVAKDKPDNILQVLNSKEFYVPKTVIPPFPPEKKWKLFATGKDFEWNKINNEWECFTTKLKKGDILFFQNSPLSAWDNLNVSLILFIISDANYANTLYINRNNEVVAFHFDVRVSGSGFYMEFSSKSINEYMSVDNICVWKLEDAFEMPPIPPTPIISKNTTYEFYKKVFKK